MGPVLRSRELPDALNSLARSVLMAAPGGSGSVIASAASQARDTVPTMPTTPYTPQHRPKLHQRIPINGLVARPVSPKEQKANLKAHDEMKKEWKWLRKMGTWDEYEVCELRDVARKARQNGEEVHFGYLLGLCSEKRFRASRWTS